MYSDTLLQIKRGSHIIFFLLFHKSLWSVLIRSPLWGATKCLGEALIMSTHMFAFNIYLKPKVTLQLIFIHFTDFCWVKLKHCFNDVKEQSFVHMIHVVEPFLLNRLSKGSLAKLKGSKSKVTILIHFWKVNVHLYLTYTGLCQAKMLYSLRHVLKIVLK